MKKQSLITLGLLSVLMLSAVGCGNTDSTETMNITESEVALAASVENTEVDSENKLIYGTVNLPYADFYYGELNQIQPETDATAGQYNIIQ